MDYKLFAEELKKHGNSGYHFWNKVESIDDLPHVSIEYIEFVKEIGVGSYFGGRLKLFTSKDKDFEEFNYLLKELNCHDFVAIGYDGTTEGCYCLKKEPQDNAVYWMAWSEGSPFQINDSFYSWIEKAPSKFFNEKVFRGFKNIKDINSINYIINQRRKINLRLLSFDKELVAHPNETKKYLKRYNKICLEIIKTEKTEIKWLTIKMLRTGSTVGNDNIDFVTIDIENIIPLKPTRIECLLFDSFNLPFESIICQYAPEIDLGSSMRSAFKEITTFL